MALAKQEGSASELKEVTFETMEAAIVEAAVCLRMATLAMRSCQSVNASSVAQFVQLRNGVLNEANAYKLQVLPIAEKSCLHVQGCMDYFAELDPEDLLEIIDDIKADAVANHAIMEICRDMHFVMSVKFKEKEDLIAATLAACALEAKKYEERAQAAREGADSNHSWASGLSLIPVVGPIAGEVFNKRAKEADCEAIAAEEESQLAVNAACVVRDVLSKAITNYVEAMETFTQAFTVMANGIQHFQRNLQQYSETEKQSFWKMCKSHGKRVSNACDKFAGQAQCARTDLACLPPPSDKNYVQQWLASQKAEGKETFKERFKALGPAKLGKEIKEVLDEVQKSEETGASSWWP